MLCNMHCHGMQYLKILYVTIWFVKPMNFHWFHEPGDNVFLHSMTVHVIRHSAKETYILQKRPTIFCKRDLRYWMTWLAHAMYPEYEYACCCSMLQYVAVCRCMLQYVVSWIWISMLNIHVADLSENKTRSQNDRSLLQNIDCFIGLFAKETYHSVYHEYPCCWPFRR